MVNYLLMKSKTEQSAQKPAPEMHTGTKLCADGEIPVFRVLHGPTRLNNLSFFFLFLEGTGKNEFLDNMPIAA
jgi:hypothetical protein